MSNTACVDCAAPFVSDGLTPGYAILPTKDRVCYACADKRQRRDLKDRTHSYTAYLSGDGKTVTTWTGGELGKVTSSRPCRLTRPSFTHNAKAYRTVWVTDVHGAHWIGRGSPGIALTLRPVK